ERAEASTALSISVCARVPLRRSTMSARNLVLSRSIGSNDTESAAASGLAAFHQAARIEQFLQLLARELRLLRRHVKDGPSFRVSLLRDLRALFVADHGVQGSDQDRIALERRADAGFVDGEPRNRRIGQYACRIREQVDALQEV